MELCLSFRESHYLKWLALRLTNSWQRWAFIKKRIPKTKCQRSSASLQRKTVPLKANPPARPLRMILTNQRPIPSTQICNPLTKRDDISGVRTAWFTITTRAKTEPGEFSPESNVATILIKIVPTAVNTHIQQLDLIWVAFLSPDTDWKICL